MDPNPTAGRFQTTSWTLIAHARGSRTDLEALLERYWSPVYAWLRRRGHGFEEAADITQSFLWDVVLSRDLIGKANPRRGRFRTYLLTALKRFEIDTFRREHGREGHRAKMFLPTDPQRLKLVEPSVEDDPSSAFDRQWATTIFHEALLRTEAECNDNGMAAHWRAYDARYIQPALRGVEPCSIDDLVAELGAQDAAAVSSMIHTAKRKFRQTLKEVVAETLDDPADLDEEFAALRRFLVM